MGGAWVYRWDTDRWVATPLPPRATDNCKGNLSSVRVPKGMKDEGPVDDCRCADIPQGSIPIGIYEGRYLDYYCGSCSGIQDAAKKKLGN